MTLLLKIAGFVLGGGALVSFVAWIFRGRAKRRAQEIEAASLVHSFEREAIAEAEKKKQQAAATTDAEIASVPDKSNAELEREMNR